MNFGAGLQLVVIQLLLAVSSAANPLFTFFHSLIF